MNAAFKLSVILLYQWYGRSNLDPDIHELERARTLMRQVWDKQHVILAGLFLV